MRSPLREYLWERGDRYCRYCGMFLTLKTGYYDTLTVDHVVPRSKGGTNAPDNIVAACGACNNDKSDMALDDYVTRSRRVHRHPAPVPRPT